jgi:hypothetical protein
MRTKVRTLRVFAKTGLRNMFGGSGGRLEKTA